MKRFLHPLLALALLGLGACQRESATNPQPTETPPATTAYVLTVPDYFPTPVVPADNPLTEQGVNLGRHLFYETALSSNNTIACATCHRQEMAFTDGLAHSLGVGGARHPRSAMAISNLVWEPKLTWDGSAPSLEAQCLIPLANPIEMNQPLAASVSRLQALPKYPELFWQAFGTRTVTIGNVQKALAQFERTLVSSHSRYDDFRRTNNNSLLSPDELAGLLLLQHPDPSRRTGRGGNCSDCHGGDLFTTHDFANNGLDAGFTDPGLGTITGRATDNGKFRIPSLRNIALTAPYMHDGRFATLQQVLDHYNDHIVTRSPNLSPLIQSASNTGSGQTLGLTSDEKRKIIAFLQTLTDTTFTQNPQFSQPKD